MEPSPHDEADERELWWPAAPEEGEVGDETTPALARHGASEEGGRDVLDVYEDLSDDVVREPCCRVPHLSLIYV
jgi:hypothetical protein